MHGMGLARRKVGHDGKRKGEEGKRIMEGRKGSHDKLPWPGGKGENGVRLLSFKEIFIDWFHRVGEKGGIGLGS